MTLTWVHCFVLVLLLGDEDWSVRQAAHLQLERAGFSAWPALLWGKTSSDPEVRWRCECILRPILDRIAYRARMVRAAWIACGPRFGDDDALLTWFHSQPQQVADVLVWAEATLDMHADVWGGYLDAPGWEAYRVPLWYGQLRWRSRQLASPLP